MSVRPPFDYLLSPLPYNSHTNGTSAEPRVYSMLCALFVGRTIVAHRPHIQDIDLLAVWRPPFCPSHRSPFGPKIKNIHHGKTVLYLCLHKFYECAYLRRNGSTSSSSSPSSHCAQSHGLGMLHRMQWVSFAIERKREDSQNQATGPSMEWVLFSILLIMANCLLFSQRSRNVV